MNCKERKWGSRLPGFLGPGLPGSRDPGVPGSGVTGSYVKVGSVCAWGQAGLDWQGLVPSYLVP